MSIRIKNPIIGHDEEHGIVSSCMALTRDRQYWLVYSKRQLFDIVPGQ
jgi:hypothetical protein